jgi:hypothetical protein
VQFSKRHIAFLKQQNATVCNNTKRYFFQIAVAFVMCSATTIVHSQITASAPISVILGTGETLTLNTSNINLDFNSMSAYLNGVHSGNDVTRNHVSVFCNVPFTISVKASGDLTNGSLTIPVNTITLTSSNGTQTMGFEPTYFPITLSTSYQTIITSTVATGSANFNIDYFAAGGSSYMNKTSTGNNETYSTTLTYTLTPR